MYITFYNNLEAYSSNQPTFTSESMKKARKNHVRSCSEAFQLKFFFKKENSIFFLKL